MQQYSSSSARSGSFQEVPEKPLEQKHPPHRRWLSIGIGLTATLVVITVLVGLLVPAPHRIGTGSGGLTPAVVPIPWSAATSTPAIFPVTPTRGR
jgi:hypothetical protein